ncbi:predicted protein [Uncinocarpus reesii 1704]|uniref:AB hydrolase-1 domain-containing protein n=1 Tax=Uncinocarpus reesii (strain UAMH 1704) TaxID=336963 RepID=C4JNN3_UNCRE|nr:uncharacterized protein UREG_03031 [Uncinocarpus reesii 1704]EEP78186.1 predicted protein [Uncinocarpus reesii 1704]
MVAITVPETLADYNLSTFEAETEVGPTIYGVYRGIFKEEWDDTEYKSDGPILVIKLLPKTTRLFVPDIPGYGHSSPCQSDHSKSTVGRAILDGLSRLINEAKAAQPQRVILIGHDRGARICHRLTVDAAEYASSLSILGTVLMDIVPTTVQWQGMANPAEARGTFHWAFLANAELATQMILQVGGDVFIRQLMERWMGSNEEGRRRLEADDAMEMYQRPFRWESVVRSSCLDYEAGATVDVQMQKADQEQGRKIEVPVLVLHCAGIGRRFDMNVWAEWVADGKAAELLTVVELGNGVGHFVAEEDPEGTVGAVVDWMQRLGVQVA